MCTSMYTDSCTYACMRCLRHHHAEILKSEHATESTIENNV